MRAARVKSVEECVHKARHTFLYWDPLEHFMENLTHSLDVVYSKLLLFLPCCMYGCETWILSDSHYGILETFEAEIGKHILGISKHHSNTSVLIGLHLPSIKARILILKLSFFGKTDGRM